MTDRVRAELEVADGDAVGGRVPEGPQVYGADVDGCAEGVELLLDLGVEGRWVGGEGYASLSMVGMLVGRRKSGRDRTDFATLIGSTPARLYICSNPR